MTTSCTENFGAIEEIIGKIFSVKECTGGLFNKVYGLKTENGDFVYKKFLDGSSSGLYAPPKMDPSVKVNHSVEVQLLWKSAADKARDKGIDIPSVRHIDRDNSAYIMDAVPSANSSLNLLKKGIVGNEFETVFPKNLARIHSSCEAIAGSEAVFENSEFRDFKLGLQYDGLEAFLTPDEFLFVLVAKESYRKKKTHVVHGDLNSNNILSGSDGSIWVIDFEQSHLGCPGYDISYILSELVICMEAHDDEKLVDGFIGRFLDNYFNEYSSGNPYPSLDIEKHLPIQILYRFLGPSKSIWTGHISQEVADGIIGKYREVLVDPKGFARL